MYKKRTLLVAILVMVVLSVSAWPVANAQDDPIEIYLVQHAVGAWDPYWVVVEQGIADAEEDFEVNVTILAPDHWCPECTAALIDQALAAQPDAIGVTVSDGVLFDEPMRRAIDTGIPVMAYNTADMRPAGERIPYLAYIGQDEYVAGLHTGQRTLTLDGVSKAVCINHVVGHVGTDANCSGFAEVLAEAGIDSEVLGVPQEPTEAATVIGDYFTAHPDVDTAFTVGSIGATAFYAYLDASGMGPGEIVHVTGDLAPDIIAKIKDGTTAFAIDGQPYLQGYLTVQWLAWIVQYGFTLPGDVLTGPGFVHQGNVDLVEAWGGTYR